MSSEGTHPGAEGTERAFLHDLSNPLAIAYGNMRLIVTKLEKDKTSMDIEAILVKLKKAGEAFDKATALLEARRAFLKSQGLGGA